MVFATCENRKIARQVEKKLQEIFKNKLTSRDTTSGWSGISENRKVYVYVTYKKSLDWKCRLCEVVCNNEKSRKHHIEMQHTEEIAELVYMRDELGESEDIEDGEKYLGNFIYFVIR